MSQQGVSATLCGWPLAPASPDGGWRLIAKKHVQPVAQFGFLTFRMAMCRRVSDVSARKAPPLSTYRDILQVTASSSLGRRVPAALNHIHHPPSRLIKILGGPTAPSRHSHTVETRMNWSSMIYTKLCSALPALLHELPPGGGLIGRGDGSTLAGSRIVCHISDERAVEFPCCPAIKHLVNKSEGVGLQDGQYMLSNRRLHLACCLDLSWCRIWRMDSPVLLTETRSHAI